MFTGGELVEFLDRVHPLHAEVSLLRDGRDIFDSREGRRTFLRIGNVVVEKSQVKLHMHCLLEELP
jgi:hypothetical protein